MAAAALGVAAAAAAEAIRVHGARGRTARAVVAAKAARRIWKRSFAVARTS